MRQIQRSLILWSALLALILLAGCGSNISTTGAAGLSTATPAKPSSTAATASVTVHTDKLFYLAGETISVTVSNQSNQTISLPDHLTNCTVILLQRQKAQRATNENEQAGINPCLLSTPTRMHALASGQHLVVQLVAPKSSWPTGWFLATLSYRASPTASQPTTVSSAAFTIGPLGL
jgi:hypothetical protein